MSKKKILIGIGIFVIIAIFVGINLNKKRGKEIPVQVEKVKRGDLSQIVSGSGKIQPETEVKISANVSSEITGIYVQEGNDVKRGQLLVELDRTKYLAALDQAKSNLKSSDARLMKARSDYKRMQALFEQKLSAEADLENAEANLKLAESDVEQAQALQKQAEDDLEKTRLYAPMNGTVTSLNKEVGEIALGSMFQADVIMVVADLSRMEVLAEIDENDVVLVTPGDSVSIEVDAMSDTTVRGIVSEIAHTATTRGLGTQEEITNFKVKIFILDNLEKIRTGMSATVDIQTETRRNVLHLPIQAVTVRSRDEVLKKDTAKADTTGSSAEIKKEDLVEVVFVVNQKVAHLKEVETGISSDTDIEIISGLEEAQEVVVGSYRVLSKTLKDGDAVKIGESVVPK